MSNIMIVGVVGFMAIVFGALVSTFDSAGQSIIIFGIFLIGISVFMMFSEIHEKITREDEIEEE